MSRCSLYCIVSEHLYSVTHSLHQSKALPVQETLRTFKAVPKQGKDPGRSPVSNYERDMEGSWFHGKGPPKAKDLVIYMCIHVCMQYVCTMYCTNVCMYIWIWVCVYMNVCMTLYVWCTCRPTCMNVHIMHVCMDDSMNIHMKVLMNVRTHVCMYLGMYMRRPMHVCPYVCEQHVYKYFLFIQCHLQSHKSTETVDSWGHQTVPKRFVT